MPKARLNVTSNLVNKNGKNLIIATVKNVGSSIAFAIHLQAIRERDGERILPVIMNDNYFTLMNGESKNITIEFEESLLKNSGYKLLVEPYNK